MEEIIFRSYLNFAKKEDLKLWRKLTRLPFKLIVLFGCAILSDVVLMIACLVPNISTYAFWITLLIALILVVILFF